MYYHSNRVFLVPSRADHVSAALGVGLLKWLWSVYVRHQHEVLDKDNN